MAIHGFCSTRSPSRTTSKSMCAFIALHFNHPPQRGPVVECGSLPTRLCILARYPENTGTNLSGLTKTKPEQGGRRCRHRELSTQVCNIHVSCPQETHAPPFHRKDSVSYAPPATCIQNGPLTRSTLSSLQLQKYVSLQLWSTCFWLRNDVTNYMLNIYLSPTSFSSTMNYCSLIVTTGGELHLVVVRLQPH
jgi:hypothetical protein